MRERAVVRLKYVAWSLLSVSIAAVSLWPASALAAGNTYVSACPRVAAYTARCYAKLKVNAISGHPLIAANANGLGPSDLHSAYRLPGLPARGQPFVWNGQTVAIVDAYNNPNAAGDLLAYRKYFHLPLCSSGKSVPTVKDLTGCLFAQVNQQGQASPLPRGDTGWGQEIDLDIQMAAAVCPMCKILLVEANSSSMNNLALSVDTAARLGATAISNSYGGPEFSTETTVQSHYNHPGIAITVSSGDSGYGAEFPASSQFVTAVGGTSLQRTSSTTRGWVETAWNGAGSGCSHYITRPLWQAAIGGCSHRTVADVAAVADPNTGLAVYDSYGSPGQAWFVVGGTSAASPIIASVYALAHSVSSRQVFAYGELPYARHKSLFDIVTGTNGNCGITIRALCTAGSGYDGPTGLGSPNGLSGF
jgi:subtilase family serine protease